ncbi:MAG: RNA polymerase sigma factor [Bacteroidetes bacterium]|nr:MAG: RNA polymerase sigma factor [Bacteroidota bacterium]
MDELIDLVHRAQAGDQPAEEQILIRLQPVFQRFFRKRLGTKTDVDDLVQNSLLRIHRGLTDLKDPEKLRGFAMKAAFFELNDFYRGRYSIREILLEALPERESEGDESAYLNRLDVSTALNGLTPKARQIIVLREQGYRYEEIASMIDSTEAAVKMQVKRAFKKLRKLLIILIVTFPW